MNESLDPNPLPTSQFGGASPPTLGAVRFCAFQQLPPELRLKIWEHELDEQPFRIIKVALQGGDLTRAQLREQGVTVPFERQHDLVSVWVDVQSQVRSRLFFVNQEARSAALSRYRVRIPCWRSSNVACFLTTSSIAPKLTTLYFCPERDFIELTLYPTYKTHPEHVAQFLHDLKTVHDPRGVGLLNVAVDTHHVMKAFCSVDLATLDPAVRTSYGRTLAQLKEIFFMTWRCDGERESRQVPIYQSDAFPVIVPTPYFKRPGPDPRSINSDLDCVNLPPSVRTEVLRWKDYIRRFPGLERRDPPATLLRVLIARKYSVEPDDLVARPRNHSSAESYLQTQIDRQHFRSIFQIDDAAAARLDDPSAPDSTDSPASRAFGFWLFPADVCIETPDNPSTETMSINLEQHWPELALLEFPSLSDNDWRSLSGGYEYLIQSLLRR